jgi:hypothetical protein
MFEFRAVIRVAVEWYRERKFFETIIIKIIAVGLRFVATRSDEVCHAITRMRERPQRAARFARRKLRTRFDDAGLLLIVSRPKIEQMGAGGAIRAHHKFRITLIAEINVADEMSEKLGWSSERFEVHSVTLKKLSWHKDCVRRIFHTTKDTKLTKKKQLNFVFFPWPAAGQALCPLCLCGLFCLRLCRAALFVVKFGCS